MVMSLCPDREQLRQFLAGELSRQQHACLERHVACCIACQKLLEELEDTPTVVQGPLAASSRSTNPKPHEIPTRRQPHFDPAGAISTSFELRRGGGATTAEPVSGRTFAGYELLEKIARGGMGVVWKARQLALNRIVAVKMIGAGDLATDEEVQRFRHEAEAAAQLDHPGIVPVFEVGLHEGTHYFSMAYVEGGSLAARVKEGPLPQREAAVLVKQAAEAIAFAHERGIIHRDLKPSNVLLDKEKRAKVTDFGLAKRVQGASQVTVRGQVLGTPSYMPPEQAAGKADEVGAAADIYSLGALLYCLLSGRPPFQAANSVDTLRQVLEQEPVPLRSLNSAVTRDLETICMKCLQKESVKRYQTAKQLADDLGRFLRGEPIRARPVRNAERLWRWCRRNPTISGSVAAAVLAFAAAFIGITWSYFDADAARKAEGRQRKRALEEKRLSDRRRYVAEIVLAQQRSWKDCQILDLLARLDDLKPQSSDEADLRDFEWYYLHRQCRLDLHTFVEGSEPLWAVGFSPKGDRLASGGGRYGQRGEIHVRDVASGKLVHSWVGHSDRVTSLAYSPDGRWLATASGSVRRPGELKLWDATNFSELLNLKGHTDAILCLAFSPDGRWLASGSGEYNKDGRILASTVKLWDLKTGTLVRSLPGHEAHVRGLAFSHDGRRFASADTDGAVLLWDVESDEPLFTLWGHAPLTSVALSPDGSRVAAGSKDRTVKIWDLGKKGDPVHNLPHTGEVTSVAYSPQGPWLAAGSEDHLVWVWDAATGKQRCGLRGHSGAVSAVAFSPDGWRLASAGTAGTVKVWDALTPQETTVLRGHRNWVHAVVYGPDGNWLASASCDQTVRVWHPDKEQQVRALYGHADAVTSLACSADGRWLVSGGEDFTVRLWDVTRGEPVRTFHGCNGPVWGVAVHPNGRYVAAASGGALRPGNVKIWELDSAREVFSYPKQPGNRDVQGFFRMAYSPDGRFLAAACRDYSVLVWEFAPGQGDGKPSGMLTLTGHQHSVLSVAFSPDGQKLASGSADKTIKIWDVANGEELHWLRGHGGGVEGLAFSPRGERLASSSLDRSVKLWDPVTGQELLTLSYPHELTGLAFRPDGLQLATGCKNFSVVLWDAMPLSPELLMEREARGVVQSLFARNLSEDKVVSLLKADATISDRVRQRALELVEPYNQGLVLRQAEDVIYDLSRRQSQWRERAREQIRSDPALSEPVRLEALALLDRLVEHAGSLSKASRETAYRADADAERYDVALEQAHAASRLVPAEGKYRVTLGMAQYRCGHFAEAVKTLTRIANDATAAASGPEPIALAFLAMAHHQLGQREQARVALERLRRSIQEPPWVNDSNARDCWAEAERLLATM
jgi:WD40 repeat protein